MIDFKQISHKTIIGRLLRFSLRFIPPHTVLPILQGELRRSKWIIGASIHGCWLGSYEYKMQRLFKNMISQGSVVYDIGAHAGFYTLLASKIVGLRGKVVAFEPYKRSQHLKTTNYNSLCFLSVTLHAR